MCWCYEGNHSYSSTSQPLGTHLEILFVLAEPSQWAAVRTYQWLIRVPPHFQPTYTNNNIHQITELWDCRGELNQSGPHLPDTLRQYSVQSFRFKTWNLKNRSWVFDEVWDKVRWGYLAVGVRGSEESREGIFSQLGDHTALHPARRSNVEAAVLLSWKRSSEGAYFSGYQEDYQDLEASLGLFSDHQGQF